MKRHASMSCIYRLVWREMCGSADVTSTGEPATRPSGWQLTLKPATATLLVALSALSAHAAEPPPNAGTILREIQQIVPPLPSPGGTGLAVEQQDAGQLPASEPFQVNSISIISGNTVFDTPTLHALVADAEGQNLTLPQLG